MFERFTERARQVVVLAQEEARNGNRGHIAVGHILIGVAREEEGVGAKALRAFDLTPEIIRKRLKHLPSCGDDSDTNLRKDQLPFTPKAKKVLEGALREALSLGHNYIGTEHILLGLLRVSESRRLLEGVLPEEIEAFIKHLLGGPPRVATKESENPVNKVNLADMLDNVANLLESIPPILSQVAKSIREVE